MTREIALLTPEKAVITLRLATIGSRVTAQLFDLFLVVVISMALMLLVAQIPLLAPAWAAFAELLAVIIVSFGFFAYFIFFEGLWNGLTPGKRMAGIRVCKVDGTPIDMRAAMGRNFLRIADFLPFGYFAGLLATFTSPRSQRLGDMVAGTIVVGRPTELPQVFLSPHTVGVHPYERVVGPLTGMTTAEYMVLRRICDRYPEFDAATQARLVREVWRPLAHRLGVPIPAGIPEILVMEAVVMKFGRIHGLL